MQVAHYYQQFLINFPCFAVLNAAELSELAQQMEEICLFEHEVIVKEGDIVDSIYIIISGRAEVSVKEKVIATLSAGEAIGLNELGFYSTTGIRTATVIASSNIVLLRLTLENLNAFLFKFPHANVAMQQAAQQMLRMQLIKKAQPFLHLASEHLQWLTPRINECTFAADTLIFSEGDKADSCYIVSKGSVKVFVNRGNKEKNIAVLTKAALLGEIALITSLPRNANARALEETVLLKLAKSDFIELLKKDKKTSAIINELVLERARLFHNKHTLIQQHQSADGANIITLRNPHTQNYYQLSEQGLYVYHLLNGKNRIHDIVALLKNTYKIYDPDFVYQLIVDLINGGFATFTPNQLLHKPKITILNYDADTVEEVSGAHFDFAEPFVSDSKITWINVVGLHDLDMLNQLVQQYNLHALTIEDILNVVHRSKVERFNDYLLLTLKVLSWDKKHHKLYSEQVSIILTQNRVLSFVEKDTHLFDAVRDSFHTQQGKNIRQQSSDYLVYLLLDAIIDQYFRILEALSAQIEKIEMQIIAKPTEHNPNKLYRYKRQLLVIHKTLWATRDVIKHVIHSHDTSFASSLTAMYLKDLYDRANEAMDALDTLQDSVGGMLDVYLSNVSIRMSETMKVLTIISTVFIPISTIASIFGMTFYNMPFIASQYGFYVVLGLMLAISISMLIYYKWKRWF